MRSVLLILGGVALGFAAAHLVNSTERGREFFAGVNARIDAVTQAVRDGYDQRTSELITAIEREQ